MGARAVQIEPKRSVCFLYFYSQLYFCRAQWLAWSLPVSFFYRSWEAFVASEQKSKIAFLTPSGRFHRPFESRGGAVKRLLTASVQCGSEITVRSVLGRVRFKTCAFESLSLRAAELAAATFFDL